MKFKIALLVGALAFVTVGGADATETVVFERPNGPSVDRRFKTARPEQCMPFGAGNLSAMTSFGGNSLELHLSRADYILSAWKDRKRGLLQSPDLPSVGHVTVEYPGLALADFRQVMDVERGEVRLTLADAAGEFRLVCSGDRESGALIVEPDRESASARRSARVTYECGRVGDAKYESTLIGDGRSWAELAETDPRSHRHYATRVEFADGRLVIASATAQDGAAASSQVRSTVAKALAESREALESRRLEWWRKFWSQGDIMLTGDERAEKLAKYWKINLYCWANVGYGELPPKFNGGPGLVFGDSRKWGADFWWQNTRELIWPMAAAGHPEFAKSSLLLYDSSLAQVKADFENDPTFAGFQGAYLPETMRLEAHPLCHPDKGAKRPDRRRPYVPLSAAEREAGRRRRLAKPATFTSHVYSSGAEYVQQLVEYVRWTGDETLLPVIADWTREQCEFYLGILEKGEDGHWHVRATNVNESWWQVDDSLVDLCGARFVFAMAAAHGAEWGYPAALVADVKARLDHLAPVPTVGSFDIPPISPTNDYLMAVRDVVPGNRRFVPTPLKNGMIKRAYAPNEIYIVHPFGLIDAASAGADRDRAIAAYRGLCREADFTGGDGYHLGYWGWDHLGVAAVRLGLKDAADEVWKHVYRTMRWPFGGAKSPAGVMYPGCEVEDAPYFDGSGVLMTELQEMLLQSQAVEPDANLFGGGVLRLLPCVPETWSGSYKLRARGGFIVECAFERGEVKSATFTATRAATLRYQDPLSGKTIERPLAAGGRVSVK